jgi:hypothetical protein
MRSWREKFHAMAMAVAFAEEGEWETAKSLLKEPTARRTDKALDSQKRTDQRVRKQMFRF